MRHISFSAVSFATFILAMATGALATPAVQYDEELGALCLTNVESGHVRILVDGVEQSESSSCAVLPKDSTNIVHYGFELLDPSGALLFRRKASFYSEAFYRSYNQVNTGIIVLLNEPAKDGSPANDVRNAISDRRAPASAIDTLFMATFEFVEAHNNIARGGTLCASRDGLELLRAVGMGECYVVCVGRADIQRDVLQMIPRRLTLLHAQEQQYKDGIRLLQSESHTTIELYDGSWYLADPSFGFAYVIDADGNRLDAEQLIASLIEDDTGNSLRFAVARDGALEFVPGPQFIESKPSLVERYYTPDKRITWEPLPAASTREPLPAEPVEESLYGKVMRFIEEAAN